MRPGNRQGLPRPESLVAMSFSAIDGYAVYADLRCGSNNLLSGVPELDVGASPDDENSGKIVWDSNLSDGFDSGWVSVELDINAAGGQGSVVWSVQNISVGYASQQFNEIDGFILRAGVSASGSIVSFRNVYAQFFWNGSDAQPAQTVIQDGATASTVGTTASDAEDIVLMGPDGSGYRKARVFAQVRMQSPSLPNPNDLFGQVFVYAS